MENAKVENAFVIFIVRLAFRSLRTLKHEGKSKADSHSVEDDQAKEHLKLLDTHKSMGLDGIYLQVLSKLLNLIVRQFLIVFERSWQM